MSSSFLSSRKHPREPSTSPADDDCQIIGSIEKDGQKKARKRAPRQNNERRSELLDRRATQTKAMKGLEGLALEEDIEDDQSPVSRGRTLKKRRDTVDRASSPTSPKRPTVSPLDTDMTLSPLPSLPAATTTTTDPLTAKLAKITNLITADHLQAAYKLLTSITRTDDWQVTATRGSILQIYNFTKLLGDGKRQGMDQARIINDARREVMELQSEIRVLIEENAKLRIERRG